MGAKIINIGEDKRFLLSCLECLASNYEINEVLVEAGAGLSGALLETDLLDELVLYQAPVILGDKAASLFEIPEIKSMADKYSLSLVDIRHIGENIRMIYEFKK